jgi:peptidyl-Lys metalloendopeptidase
VTAFAVPLLVVGPVPARAEAPLHPVTARQGQDENAVNAPGRFSASLTAKPQYRLGEPIALTFDLRNASDEDQSVLEWDTPLDSPGQEVLDYLRVSRGSGDLPYQGRRIKRGDPDASSYRLVRAGETLSSTIDVSTSYAITEPGTYTATLDTHLRDVITRTATAPAARALGQFTRADLPEVSVTFEVVTGDAPRLPVGAALADDGEDSGAADVPRAALEPRFRRGTEKQRDAVRAAHDDAWTYSREALGILPSPAPDDTPNRYTTWFGAYKANRYDLVVDHYTKIKRHLANTRITYDLAPASCQDSYYAFVYADQPTEVYLCKQFWNAPGLGTDSKAGTVVHELSHFTVNGGTEDIRYGQDGCKELAREDPSRAVRNADSHEYFAESIPID